MADHCPGPMPAPLLWALLSIHIYVSFSHHILSVLRPLFHLLSNSFNPSPGSQAASHLQVPPELPSKPPISHRPFIKYAGLTAGLWAALSCSGILHLEVSGAHPGTSPRGREGLTIQSGQGQGSRLGTQVQPWAMLFS